MKNKGLLYKFLISYALIFLLPVMIILSVFYPFSTALLKEKSSAWNEHTTEQLMNSMDIFTKYVYNLPAEILQNREIKLYMVNENPYHKIVIMNEMRKYNITDAFIENTLLYLKDADYFFSKRGSAYKMEDFNRKGVGYVYPNWPIQEIEQQLHNLTTPMIRPSESIFVPGGHQMNVLSFILPLPLGGEHSPGSILILVKEETILDMMRSSNEESKEIFLITDENKQCLVSNISCELINNDIYQHILAEDNTSIGIKEIGIEEQQYLVSEKISDSNGWHYIRLLPVSETLNDIRMLQYRTLLTVIVVVALTSILIYFSVRSNYHPIRHLVKLASSLFEDSTGQHRNEIETIHTALSQLSSTTTTLNEQLKQTEPKIREQLLFNLLLGHYNSWEQFHAASRQYQFPFDAPYLTTATILVQSDQQHEAIQNLCSNFTTHWNNISIHVIPSYYKREIILLLSHQSATLEHTLFSDLQKAILDKLGQDCWIGISNPLSSTDINHCNVSYLQASRCLEHIRFLRRPTIAYYSEALPTAQVIISYQSELVQSLELAVLKNDIEGILTIMQRIEAYMGSEGLLPHMIRTLYLNTMSILFQALEKLQQDNSSILSSIEFVFQQRFTLEQMFSVMNDTTEKLCELLKAAVPQNNKRTPSELIQEILNQHWSDPNLSLQFMADQFSMSSSNFSYHFKKTMGQNFKEYIDHVRIQHSLQLLRTTDYSVEAVSQQVGYLNASSFIRSFKKMIGMTPGQYREQYKELE